MERNERVLTMVETLVPITMRVSKDGVFVATSPLIKGLVVVSKDRDKLLRELVPEALKGLADVAYMRDAAPDLPSTSQD